MITITIHGFYYFIFIVTTTFADNVGVYKITTNVRKRFDQTGPYPQYFTASDKAGNRAKCNFDLLIGGENKIYLR